MCGNLGEIYLPFGLLIGRTLTDCLVFYFQILLKRRIAAEKIVQCLPDDIALFRANELGVGLKFVQNRQVNLEINLLELDLGPPV